jgi:hypothetical protein
MLCNRAQYFIVGSSASPQERTTQNQLGSRWLPTSVLGWDPRRMSSSSSGASTLRSRCPSRDSLCSPLGPSIRAAYTYRDFVVGGLAVPDNADASCLNTPARAGIKASPGLGFSPQGDYRSTVAMAGEPQTDPPNNPPTSVFLVLKLKFYTKIFVLYSRR